MPAIGKLFRGNEIAGDPIAVTYDVNIPAGGALGRINGTIAVHEDPDFARNNLFEEFTLVMEEEHAIHIVITNDLGAFVSDGLRRIV